MITIPAHLSGAAGEEAKRWQNPVSPAGSAGCVPRARVVGTGPLQLHKTCRVVTPTCWFGAEHSQPDASSHSWTLRCSAFQQYLGVGPEGSLAKFEMKNARRSCWQLPFQAAWELSLAQRAPEQLWDGQGEKGADGEPVWQTQGVSCACQGIWTLRSHHQSSSHWLLSAVSVGSKETPCYKHLKKKKEKENWPNWFIFLKKCFILLMEFSSMWKKLIKDSSW